MLLPRKDVLMHNLARCNYVAHLWKHAHLRDPLTNMQPTHHGWKVFLPLRFTGMTTDPTDVSDGKDGDDDNDEEYDNITEDESEDDDDDSDVD